MMDYGLKTKSVVVVIIKNEDFIKAQRPGQKRPRKRERKKY